MTIPLYSIKHKVLPQTQCGREVAFIPRYPGGVIPSVWHLSKLARSAEKPCTREPWALGRSTECCPYRGQQPARGQRGAALPYRVKHGRVWPTPYAYVFLTLYGRSDPSLELPTLACFPSQPCLPGDNSSSLTQLASPLDRCYSDHDLIVSDIATMSLSL